MADIKVRIELNENAESEKIGSVKTDNLTFANTSIAPNSAGVFNNMPTRNNTTKGINALTFGQELYFNENGMLDNVDNYGGGLDSDKNKFEIVWGIVNSDNSYNVKITFENAQNLKDIVIYGDKESNQFPTRAILDGTTEIFSDDYIWTLQFENESDTHTIEFTHWNRANYNAVLTFIGVMLKYIEIDKRNGLKSIESLSQSTGQPQEIFYGVVPSTGSLELVDVNGEIADMVRDGIIPNSNINVEISANGNIVQKHISQDSEYNNNSKIYKVDVVNKLDDWDKLTYSGRELTDNKNAYELLLEILLGLGFNNSIEIDYMLSDYIIYNDIKYSIKEYLKKINIPYPYLESSTYREAIDKICTLAQLQVMYSDNGMPKFVSARPVFSKGDVVVKIPSKSILGNFNKTIILKNKYDGVDISIAKVNINESFNKIAYEKSVSDFTENLINTQKHNTEMDNHGTAGGYYFTFALMKNTYMDISFYVPKFSNKNFKEITNLYDGVKTDENGNKYENITYTMEYSKETGTASANATYNGIYRNPSVVQTSYKTFDKFNGKINSDSFTHQFGSASITVKANDISNITDSGIITTYDNGYEIKNLKILIGKELIGVGADGSFENWEDKSIGWSGDCTLYKATKLKISINGDVKEISVDYIEDNSPNIENAKTVATIKQNEILQSGTNIDNILVSNIIKDNIFSDYSNGVSNGNLSVVCSDYYDINDNKIKDWAKGEILQVGNIVRVDKDNNGSSAINYADGSDMYFRVTGRNFRYSGVPLLDLELQEVKQVIVSGGLYADKEFTNQIYSWDELINNGTLVLSEDFTTIISADKNIEGYLKPSLGITTIGKKAFINCSSLLGVDLSNCREIKESAFENCIGLTEIKIYKNLSKLEYAAFYGCSNLTNITFEEGSQLKSIDGWAFGYCEKITRFVLPESITTIGDFAFYSCSRLEEILLNNNLKTIGQRAFVKTSIHYISIPEGLQTIKSEAFMECNGLYQIEIPDSVITIESGAFAICESLEYAKIGNGVTTIQGIFNNCSKLINIDLGENINEIGDRTFYNCSYLTNISIPKKVSRIGEECFFGCQRLSNVEFEEISTWKASDGSSYYNLNVSNSSANATYLKETYLGEWTKL